MTCPPDFCTADPARRFWPVSVEAGLPWGLFHRCLLNSSPPHWWPPLHFSLLDSQLPSVHSIFLFDINSYFGSVDLLYCSKHEFWRVTLLENLLAQTVFSISSYFINSATARASHSLTSLTTARCREPEVSDTRYCSLRHGRPCVLAPHRSTLPALRRRPSLLMCPCSPCYLRTPPPITCVVGTGQCLPQPTSTPWSLPKVLPDCFLPCQFSNY